MVAEVPFDDPGAVLESILVPNCRFVLHLGTLFSILAMVAKGNPPTWRKSNAEPDFCFPSRRPTMFTVNTHRLLIFLVPHLNFFPVSLILILNFCIFL